MLFLQSGGFCIRMSGTEEISEASETGGFDVVVIALLELIFYQRIGRHIRDTRNIANEQVAWGSGNQLPH